jgi:hypothetical protein
LSITLLSLFRESGIIPGVPNQYVAELLPWVMEWKRAINTPDDERWAED